MGRGGWNNRKAEPSGYEVGRTYYICREHLLRGDTRPDGTTYPPWLIEEYEVLGETKHYVKVQRVGVPKDGMKYDMLKLWAAYPTRAGAVAAKVAEFEAVAERARDRADRAELDAISLAAWAITQEIEGDEESTDGQ